jgi:hypothetical protein
VKAERNDGEEPGMMSEKDEADLRSLLAMATQDRPAGIDLLGKVRRPARRPGRSRSRRLVPALASLATVAVVGAVAVTMAALPRAPSAQAQVTAAAEHTSGQSFRVQIKSTQQGDGKASAAVYSGAFDPARRIGVLWREDGAGRENRFVGDYVYEKAIPGDTLRRLPTGKHWISYPRADMESKKLPASASLIKLAPQDPQAALRRLRAATDVRERSTASGPGWTGHRYSFRVDEPLKAGKHPHPAIGLHVTGTVDIDAQGRVRRLDFTFEMDWVVPGKGPAKAGGPSHSVMEFSAYGTRVTVVAPPARQVIALARLAPVKPEKTGGAPAAPMPGKSAKPSLPGKPLPTPTPTK